MVKPQSPTMKQILGICVLVFLLTLSGVSGEDEEACLTEERIGDLVGCFTDKFLFLFDELLWLDLTPFSVDSHSAMRSLKNIREPEDRQPRDRPAKLNELATMIDAAGEAHRTMYRTMGRQAQQQPSKEEKLWKDINEVLQRLNSDTLLSVISNQLNKIGSMAGDVAHKLNQVQAMAASSTQTPNPTQNDILDDILNILCNQLNKVQVCHLLAHAVPCLTEKNYTAVQMEDGLKWVNCLYECNDLRPISQCVVDVFSASECEQISWIDNVILKYFFDFMEQDECDMVEILEYEDPDTPIVLVEGDPTSFIEFRPQVPPGVFCVPSLSHINTPLGIIQLLGALIFGSTCNVEVQVSLSNHLQAWGAQRILEYIIFPIEIDLGNPKCRSGQLIHQAMIGYHNYSMNAGNDNEEEEEEEEENGCKVTLTSENWQDVFTLPIRATVDNKYDGDVTGMTLTLKTVAGGLPKSTTKQPLHVLDRDVQRVGVCQAVSDPHITTFDRFYYNNMYEGYFVMYQNTNMSYEVQIVTQKCGPSMGATCTCAVAVKSGDDVFVIDKCIRVSDNSSESGSVDRPTRVALYVNGELTQGTQIFKSDDGMKFQVLLPHGTKVGITGANSGVAKNHLNVFIRGSSIDYGHTRGLCGVFSEDTGDDLTMPNGTVYDGEGSGRGGQPRGFSKAWRIPKEDSLFWGAEADPDADNDVDRYCACHHIVLLGVQCTCQSNIVEQCDLDLKDGDLTDNLGAVWKRSPRQVKLELPNFIIRDTDIDVDEHWEPPEIDFRNNSIWEGNANSFCTNAINNNHPVTNPCYSMIREIFGGFSNPFVDLIAGCVDDIKITDNTDWLPAAIEATKDYCLEYLNNQITHDEDDWDELMVVNCPWDCYGNGDCINSTCVCNSNYTGVDCSIPLDALPTMIMHPTQLCDRRYENCKYATIYGHNFALSDEIKCGIETLEVSETGIIHTGKKSTVDTFYVSPSQVVCELPDTGSYTLQLQWSSRNEGHLEPTSGDESVVLDYDSACFTCHLGNRTCVRKTDLDHCIIDGECYAAFQFDAVDDDCQVCHPNVSTSEWDYHQSEKCNQRWEDMVKEEERLARERTLRYSLAGILSGTVIIITIILFFLIGRQGKPKNDTDVEVKMEHLPGTEQDEKVAEKKDDIDGGKVNEAFTLASEIPDIHHAHPSNVYSSTSESDREPLESPQIDIHERRNRKRTKSQRSQDSALAHARGTLDREYNSDGEVVQSRQRHLSERSYREGTPNFRSDRRLGHLGRERTISTGSQASVGMGAGGPTHLGRFTRNWSLSDDDRAPGMVGQLMPGVIRL